MQIQKMKIIINVLTIGFYGWKRVSVLSAKYSLNRRVLLFDRVQTLMFLLPIFMGGLIFFEVFGLVDRFFNWNVFLGDALILSNPSEIPLELLSVFLTVFLTFSLIHFSLAFALIQHMKTPETGEVARILWFGLYALDWELSDYLPSESRAGKTEPR